MTLENSEDCLKIGFQVVTHRTTQRRMQPVKRVTQSGCQHVLGQFGTVEGVPKRHSSGVLESEPSVPVHFIYTSNIGEKWNHVFWYRTTQQFTCKPSGNGFTEPAAFGYQRR
ncbi:hypothetical protein [Streptomyces anthocyanicus]|uniref:hypothetical protein n=1 Tax=Streptomyces anthocyanicus TaxID=68174 RepID=UPI0032440A5F